MELERNKTGMCRCSDYDSTKANFDELEKRIRDLETMEILTTNCLTALEAKVKDRRWQIAGAYYPITKQPPPTCGNCKKAWRHEEYPEDVLCLFGGPSSHYVAYPKDKPACPHYERREEA